MIPATHLEVYNPRNAAIIAFRFEKDMGYADWHMLSCQYSKREGTWRDNPVRGYEYLASALSPIVCNDLLFKLKDESPELEDHDFRMQIMESVFTPDLDAKVYSYFQCEYFPLWCRFQYNDPAREELPVAANWHCDGGPDKHLKLLIYLNPTDEHGSITPLLGLESTQQLKNCGYIFASINHRLETFNQLLELKEHYPGLQLRFPTVYNMKKGSALLFEPANIAHKVIWPKFAPRGLLQICLIPSPMPWRDMCAKYGAPVQSNGWPNIEQLLNAANT